MGNPLTRRLAPPAPVTPMPAGAIDADMLQPIMAAHLSMYRRKRPHYQAVMLSTLKEIWTGYHRNLLDVGGGTGVIAQAIAALFPVGEVRAVDVVDRFCRSLTIETEKYDGRTLPFADKSFEAATLNNVIHHVPVAARVELLREICRVVEGPLYIKDHETRGRADSMRLTLLDALGNIPFGGMVRACYLSPSEWEKLARDAGYRIAARAGSAHYRTGVLAMLFPNRLEVTMRLEPA
jgi:SAM-dependent methyltransferase